MATLLFVFILFIYIGLGVPDSALGSAWPAIYLELGVNVGLNSLLTFLISLATVTASFFASKLINKLGTPTVTALSLALTGVALFLFGKANYFWALCLIALPLGFGAGAIDAAINGFVATRYNSSHMNILHCFYGVGVSITPYVFSLTLASDNDWRTGYFVLFIILIFLALLMLISFPLWKKTALKTQDEEDFKPNDLSFKQLFKTPALKSNWLIFFTTCALEFTVGAWGCTYLVTTQGLPESTSAIYLTLYYAGITGSRVASAFLCRKLSCGNILSVGFAVTGAGVLLAFLPVPPAIKGLCMLLVGLGNGPTFPNLISLTPTSFGRENSQAVIGTQMAFCNMGILIAPPLFGVFAGLISTAIYPAFTAVCFVLMVVSFILHQKSLKKTGCSLFRKI